MDVWLGELVAWIETLPPFTIYVVFFLVAYTENIVPPVPGDLMVAFGGYLAVEQAIRFSTLLWLTTLASVIGFMSMYAIGSWWGFRIEGSGEKSLLTNWFRVKYFDRGKRWMKRWGQWVIVANRFLAGTRSVIAITAGIYRTKISYTILSSTISSLIWNTILLGFGWFVHENWEIIGSYLRIYGWIVLGLILLIILVRIGCYLIPRYFKNE
ncbi:MAG: DedA family protein [Balneolaceae bacterium]